jgi:hypothetical protein
MWILKTILWIGAIILLFLGVFGGVLDIFSLMGINISQAWIISIALILLALEREVKVLSLQWRLNSKRDLQRRIDKLAEYRKFAVTRLYANTPNVDEFDEWVERYHAWETDLVSYLKKEFPYAISELFEDLGSIPMKRYAHLSPNKEIQNKHGHYLGMISKYLTILEEVIKENTSITKDREPKLSELFSSGPFG